MAEELNLNFQPDNYSDQEQLQQQEVVTNDQINNGATPILGVTNSTPMPSGGFTPTSIPTVDVDYGKLRDELFIPGSGEPISTTLDPTVITGADGLANMLNYNPVVMDYPYELDPNSKLFESSKVDMDPLESTILNYSDPKANQQLVSDPAKLQPLKFGVKATNYDRYNAPGFEHLFNKIGFHPYVDNETVYNANSTWWDENARMRGQWGRIFSTGFMSTYNAIGDAIQGNYTSGDTEGAEVFEDAMRIGNSSKGGVGGFTNNLLLNSGYTFGILANIAVEELALAGLEAITVGGATPIVASRTAYNIVRLGKAFDKTVDVSKGGATATKLTNKLDDYSTASNFWKSGGRWMLNTVTPNTYKAIKEIRTTSNTAKALSLWAKQAKTAGGFYRDARMFNLAMAESKLEAGLVENKMYNDLFHEHVAKYGTSPVGEDLQNIKNSAAESSFTTLMWNFPVIFFSNQFVLGTALRGFRGIGSIFAKTAGSVGNRVFRQSAKTIAKETAEGAAKQNFKELSKSRIKRLFEKGLSGNLRDAGASLLRYSSANLAEGFQEITQEAIAVGAEDYYKRLYADPAMGGLDAQMASVYAGVKSQASGQGFEVFMSGFLMGGLVQGPQKLVFNTLPNLYHKISSPEEFKKYKEQEDEWVKESVRILNEMADNPEMYFDKARMDAMFQKEAQQDMFDATYQGDALSFYDKKNAAVFNHLYTAAELGKLGDFANMFEDFMKMDDKGLAEAMPGQTEEDIKSGKTRERLKEMAERADQMRKSYDKLNEEIINPFDPKAFKEGTREHREEVIRYAAMDHARKLAMFAREQFTDAARRVSTIYNELSTDPVIKKMAANDIDVLTDMQALISEINLLKQEISLATDEVTETVEVKDEKTGETKFEEQTSVPELNRQEKAALEFKQKKLIALQNVFNVLTDKNNITEREAFSDAELDKIKDLDDRAKQKTARDKKLQLIEMLRQDILSTESSRNVTLEEFVNQISKQSMEASFGIFDVANKDKFTEVFIDYLDIIAAETGDFINNDRIPEFVDKILDAKTLNTRQQMLNRAVRTVLNPANLVSLAERIEPRFKKLFIDNKQAVEKRLKNYLNVTKKNIWLNELSAMGVYPDNQELALYLEKDGPIPTTFYTDQGMLNESSEQWEKANYLISAQENLTKDDVTEETTETTDPEDVDIDYEENFTSDEAETAEEELINQEGDLFLKDKWLQYVKLQASKNKTYLEFSDWVKDKSSKQFRRQAVAVEDIHQQVYSPLYLKNKKLPNFYDWLATQSENEKVQDILLFRNVSLYDILQETKSVSTLDTSKVKDNEKVTIHKSGINVSERTAIDIETGKKTKVYYHVDNNGNPVGNDTYLTKIEATNSRNKKVKTKKTAKTIRFAGENLSRGTIIVKTTGENQGKQYVVRSKDQEQVDNRGNLFIKEKGKESSRSSKDNIYITPEQFTADYRLMTAKDVKFLKNTSRLKLFEPVKINFTRDDSIENPTERTELGIKNQQELLRKLSPGMMEQLKLRVSRGPRVTELQVPLDKKANVQFGTKEKNLKLKRGAQELAIEIYGPEGSYGYFMGPTAAIFTDGANNEISVFELTESNIEDYFDLPKKMTSADALSIIQDNYSDAYYVYKELTDQLGDENIVELDMVNFPNLMLTLSEGSLTRSASNPLITFDSLDTMFVSDDTSVTIDGEKPYFIMDYSRRYGRPKTLKGKKKETMKVQGAPITNIDQSSEFFNNMLDQVDEFEANYDVLNRMGKYIAFVKLPNGKSAFVGLTAPVYSAEKFNELLVKMQEKAADVAENNVNKDGTVKKKKATQALNDEISNTIYLAAEPGVYIEIGVSNKGQLRVDYRNFNFPAKHDKGKLPPYYISNEDLMGFKDVQELLTRFNEFIKPVYPKGFTLNDIKTSIQKGEEDISVFGTLETKFTPEIKNNFRLELHSNPDVVSKDQRLRNALTIEVPESTETVDNSTPVPQPTAEEKRNIIVNDYENVDPAYELNVVRKMHRGEDINDFEQSVLDNIDGPVLAAYLLQVQQEDTKNTSTQESMLNQNYQKIAFETNENLQEFENRYWDTRYLQLKQANPNITDTEAIDVVNAEMLDIQTNVANPLHAGYQTLKKIQEDAEGRAFKVTDKFDGNSIEDINTFTTWFRNNINTDIVNLSIDTIENNAIKNQVILGQFMIKAHNLQLAGEVTVGTNNPFKYHEAFHAVFRMFLTEEEIKGYLRTAKKDVLAKLRKEGKSLSDELAAMRKQHGLYAKMSRTELEERYIEEYMADQFEVFKMDPKKARVQPEIKSLFQKIIDFLKALFGFPMYQLNSLYTDIDTGKYKNANIQENRFTASAMAQPTVAYKALTLGTKKIKTINNDSVSYKEINNFMPSDDQHILISGIANLFLLRKNNAKGSDVNTILDGAVDDFIENMNPNRKVYKDKGFLWYKDNNKKIKNYYDSLQRQKEDIKEEVRLRLEATSLKDTAFDEAMEQEEADLGNITTEQWDRTTEMIGGFSSAPKEIRQLISGVTIKDQDMFGNRFIGDNKNEPITVGVNYSKVYDSILKATANEPTAKGRLKKLWVWSQGSNIETRAVVKEIFKQLGILKAAETGVLFDTAQPFPVIKSETGSRERLFNLFTNQFLNYTVPYRIQLVDKRTGVVQIFMANKADDAHHTLVQWAESFNRRYSEIRIVGSAENKEAVRSLGELKSFINKKSISEKENVVETSVRIADRVFNATGMKIDSNYILFSLYNRLADLNVNISDEQSLLFNINQYSDPMDAVEIDEIIKSLNAGENIFLDNQEVDVEEVDEATDDITEYFEGGTKGRLRKIALNNSYFDETVGASTFVNEEGNKIYLHQKETFHLREIARMSTEDNYIDNKKLEDPFLEDNFLLNDPKFQSMIENKQVTISRISGRKLGVANLTAEGVIKENRGYNKANTQGTKYGSLTPQEFIVTLVNAYTQNYNRVAPDKSLVGSYIDPVTNEPVPFAIAPSLIRVIESTNTGDVVEGPVHKMVESNITVGDFKVVDGIITDELDIEEGRLTYGLSQEGLDAFKNIIKRDTLMIQKELNPDTATVDNVVGGNSNSKGQRTNEGRLYQLSHNGKKLLSPLKKRTRNIKFHKTPNLGEDTRKAISSGKQKVVLSLPNEASQTQLNVGDTGLVDFTVVESQPKSLLMQNKGKVFLEDLSVDQAKQLIKDLGPYIRTEKVKNKKMHAFKLFEGTNDEQVYYTFASNQGFAVAEFMRGKQSLTLFEFKDPITSDDVEVVVSEDSTTGDTTVEVQELDTSPAETFEQLIREGATFDEAWKAVDGDVILASRLFDVVNEFKELLKDFKAINKISPDIRDGLGIVKDSDTGAIINDIDIEETSELMDLYNLRVDDVDYNLTQIFLNDYINTISFNDILLGDQRLSLKDAVDAIKRAKMQNAAGVSAYSEITAPALGINRVHKNFDILLYEDTPYDKVFAEMFAEDKGIDFDPGEAGDGLVFQTINSHRYNLHGFGELTPERARIINLIQQGKELELETEFFGTTGTESYKALNSILNSEKLVYGDGKVYLKMSVFTLTPLLTSIQDENGEFTEAIQGREKWHNLRIKLEKWEEENNTSAMAVPKSASKMMKSNMAFNGAALDDVYSDILSENITTLNTKDLRKQMVVPSNKTEVVDPRQIKNLITSEQDLNATVIVEGEEVPVGTLVAAYHKAQGDKLAINWFAKRNLVFNFDKIQNDFANLKDAEDMTIDLNTFLKFAISGLQSSQARADMLSYFELNEDGTGDPKFNLNNQLTRKKFQSLFMSFISKGILSSKQPGISAALVADDGLLIPKRVVQVDDDGTPIQWEVIGYKEWREMQLNGVVAKRYADADLELHKNLNEKDIYLDRLRSDVKDFDEKGNDLKTVHTEFIMAPHHKSIIDNLKVGDKIPPAIARAYGIRIPSQDKHSAVNLKLVDFMPVYYGSSAIYARELVELSGADFDIDKLYMQIKSFFVENGKFIEYGSGKTEQEKFDQYITYTISEAKKKGSTIREAVDKYISSNPDLTFNLNEWNGMNQAEIDVLADSEVVLRIAMESIGLPATLKEYTEYKEKYNGREPYSAAIDNQILDLKYRLQGNTGMTQPRNEKRLLGVANEPANLRPLTDANAAEVLGQENAGVWEWVKKELPVLADIVSEEDVDIDNLRGKLLGYKANKEGARGIGASVQPNVVVNIAKEFGIEVRKDLPVLTINNVEYNKFVDYTIDPATGKQDIGGYRTQYVISALITAMTDNAKERLADKLGLNKSALAVVTTMTAMGVDIKTAILLVNQPVIRDGYFDAINKDDPMDPGIRKILETKAKTIISYFVDNKIKMPKTKVTTQLLTEMANRPYDGTTNLSLIGENTEEISYALSEELSVITQFLTIFDQTEMLRNVSSILTLQKEMGEDLLGADVIQEAAEELGFLMTDKQWAGSAKEPNTIPFDFRPVFMNKYENKSQPSMHVTSYNIFRESYDILFPKLFLEASPVFKDIKNLLMDQMVNMRETKDKDVLINNLTAILNTIAYQNSFKDVSEDASPGGTKQTTEMSLNNSLIYDGENYGQGSQGLNIKEVLTRLVKNKKTYNYFLDDFLSLKDAENEDNWTGIDRVVANNFTQLNDAETSRVQNSFLDLYTDPDTHFDALNLLNYLLVKDGFTKNNRGTFIDFIPSIIKKDILNSIDAVQTLFNSKKLTDQAFRRVFGMTQTQLREYITINYLQSTSSQYNVKEVDQNTKKNNPVKEIYEIDTEEVPVDVATKTILPYSRDGVSIEDSSESSHLSMTAPKQFKYMGKVYYSVDHAYQVNKTGKFNKAAYEDYVKKYKEGKIGGYTRKAKGKESPKLLTLLAKRAFTINLNKTAGNSSYVYGDLVTSATKFVMIGIPADLEVAYLKGLMQAQKEIIYTKQMFGTNKGEFVYNTKSFIQKNKAAAIESNKDSFVVDVDKGIATVSIYAGLPTSFDNKIKTVRGQFSKVKHEAKNIKLLIQDNLTNLAKKGFSNEEVLVPYRGGKSTNQFIKRRQLVLPLVVRKTMSDERTVMLVLERYQRDGKYETNVDLNALLSAGETKIYGNFAQYKIVEGGPQGSKAQWAGGFLFGERPSEQEINEFEENKRDAFAIDFVDESQLEIQIEEDPTDAEIDEIDIEEDTEASTLNVLMGLQSRESSILDELETTPENAIRDFYNALSSEDQAKLISADDVVEAYSKYETDVDTFIEHIRKCYLK